MGSNFEMSMIKTSTSHPATALLAATLIMSLNRVPGVSGVSSVDSSSFRDLVSNECDCGPPLPLCVGPVGQMEHNLCQN